MVCASKRAATIAMLALAAAVAAAAAALAAASSEPAAVGFPSAEDYATALGDVLTDKEAGKVSIIRACVLFCLSI